MGKILKNGTEYGLGGKSLIDRIYPVGSIYISTSTTFNPNTVWGGTWKKTADGRCLIGANGKYPLGTTGGEEQHTLTELEMPRHYHDEQVGDASAQQVINPLKRREKNGVNSGSIIESSWKTTGVGINIGTAPAGGSNPHNNMQPYLAVYMWERTA